MEKNLLKGLNSLRTRILNKECSTMEEFLALQDKLNDIEVRIKQLENEVK